MSALSEFLSMGHAALEADTGGDVTAGKVTYPVGGTAYACVVSSINKGNSLEIGGRVFSTKFTIHIRISALGSVVPVTGKKATYGGVDYRVGDVQRLQGFYALNLDEPDK